MRSSLALAFVLAAAACDSSNPPAVDAPIAPVDGQEVDGAAIDAAAVDAPIDTPAIDAFAAIDLDLPGGANGLHWDGATSTLYLTDSNADAVLRYTGAGLATVGTLPAASAGISLGDIVKRADGTFVVPNFGFGTQGSFFELAADGASSRILTGPAVNRRRIGLSQDSAGLLYVGYFVGGGGGSPTGGLARVTITAGAAVETDLPTDLPLKKVVGLVATPTALFVSDQTDRIIYKVALPAGTVTTVATVPSADLLTMLPNGDLLTGGTGIYRITQAGVVTTLFSGFEAVRGMAYDATTHRLFVVDHSATVGTPDKLHIRELAE